MSNITTNEKSTAEELKDKQTAMSNITTNEKSIAE